MNREGEQLSSFSILYIKVSEFCSLGVFSKEGAKSQISQKEEALKVK